MKRRQLSRPCLRILCALVGVVAVAAVAGEPPARVSFFLGSVKVQKYGTTSWEPATFNQPLSRGDRLRTNGDSRAEIMLSGGSVIRLDANSTFQITELTAKGTAKGNRGKLSVGKVWANVSKLAKRERFGVESPTAVAAVRGTVYRLNVDERGATMVRVYSGAVEVRGRAAPTSEGGPPKEGAGPGEVEGPRETAGPQEVSLEEWVEIVKAQQQISVAADGSYKRAAFDPAADAREEWVRWNQARDRALRR